jgi:hypothetical protein
MFSVILVILVAVGMTALRFYLRARVSDALDRRFGQSDADGRMPDKTLGAKLGGGLAFDAGMVAQIGAGAKARMSLNTTIMRPTIGMRALSLGLSAIVLYMIWFRSGELMPGGKGVSIALSVSILYAAIRIMFYEVRYDDRSLSTTNWLFQRCDFDMAGLVALRDNGHHVYKLRFENGKSIELQKYLVGMPDFLSYARFIMDLNAKA